MCLCLEAWAIVIVRYVDWGIIISSEGSPFRNRICFPPRVPAGACEGNMQNRTKKKTVKTIECGGVDRMEMEVFGKALYSLYFSLFFFFTGNSLQA